MSKWRKLFESSLRPFDKRPYGDEYRFGPPATAADLTAAETALGVKLPDPVRKMLLEFNGIWRSTKFDRRDGRSGEIAYLDIDHMTVHVPEYFRTCGNNLPSENDLRKVVFLYQRNGFAELIGICAEDVGEFPAGRLVKLDHELGAFEWSYKTLADLIRDSEDRD